MEKVEGPGSIGGYTKLFSKAGFDFKEVRKTWKLSSDREGMSWTDEGNIYYWTDKRHPAIEKRGFYLLDSVKSVDTEGNPKVYYFFVKGISEDVIKKLSRLLGDAVLTTDVAKNWAEGSVNLVGMRYKKKKRKNKLTGKPIIVHEGKKKYLYKFPGVKGSTFEIVAKDEKDAKKKIGKAWGISEIPRHTVIWEE